MCCLNLSELAPSAPLRARALANASVGASYVPARRVSNFYARLAIAEAQAAGSETTQAMAFARTGLSAIGMGAWHRSRPNLEHAISLAGRLGDTRLQGESLIVLSQEDYFRGRFEATRQAALRLHDAAVRHGDFQHRYWALFWQAHALMRQGRLDEALSLLEQPQQRLRARRDWGGQLIAEGAGALTLLRLGRTTEALAGADSLAERLAASSPTSHSFFEGYAAGAENFLRHAESAEGAAKATLLQRSDDALVALALYARVFAVGRPRLWLWRGLRRALGGRPHAAQRAWQRAIREARALGMPFEEAQVRFERGRQADEGERRGEQDLLEAARMFRNLGARWDLAQAEEELARRMAQTLDGPLARHAIGVAEGELLRR